MANYGIISYVNGKPILTPDGVGGIFVATVAFSNTNPATTDRRYFYDLDGMSIYGIIIGGNYHNWGTGFANGYPYIEAIGYPIPAYAPGAFTTTIAVFAK